MPGLLIDANLLVLLVIGSEDHNLIAKHRRSQSFSVEDYELLVTMVRRSGRVLVTPNVLTETSNLLGQHGDPERSRLFRKLRHMIQKSEEVVVSSEVASNNTAFEQLGLTDAVLLEAITMETSLVTTDLRLYLEAIEAGYTALNFTHLRARLGSSKDLLEA